MKIISNLNGITGETSYGNKVFYKNGINDNEVQIKRIFYRESVDNAYVKVYQYDETQPTITVTSKTGFITSSTYVLTGRVADEHSGIQAFYIDGILSSFSSDGSFSKVYSGVYGMKTITLKVVDYAGLSFSRTITINYDTSPHAISLSPALVEPTYQYDEHWCWGGVSVMHTVGTSKTRYATTSCTRGYWDGGSGVGVGARAYYNANIYLYVIPNYTEIKRVEVITEENGTQTYYISPGQSVISISLKREFEGSSSYFPSPPRMHEVGVTAGIKAIKYYFA